jgi:response regulator NasT
MIRSSIITQLKVFGSDIIFECCDGISAMSLARDCLPDIAIIDAEMPHNAGLCAVREIRNKQKIPVILLMSHFDKDTLNSAVDIGVSSVMSIPFREQDLLPAIELAIAHAKEFEQLKEEVEYLETTIESQNIINKAKKILYRSEGLSESEAFRKIQIQAMAQRRSMRHIAEAILTNGQVQKGAIEL